MNIKEFIKDFRKKKLGITELLQVNDVLKEEIDEIVKKEDTKKDEKIRKKLVGFFKNLEDNGVEVWLDKKDGDRKIDSVYIHQAELRHLHKEYVDKTVNAIIEEVERRRKEEDAKRE